MGMLILETQRAQVFVTSVHEQLSAICVVLNVFCLLWVTFNVSADDLYCILHG